MIPVLVFAALMAIKGGWLGRIPGWTAFQNSNMATERIFDGSIISACLAGLYVGMIHDPLAGVAFALAWFTGNAPSMGEEAGAIGTYRRGWGDYVEAGFPRSMGWKKGLQRGVFLGACLTLPTFLDDPSPWFILAGALFPAVYWAGQSLHYAFHKTDSWAYAEPIYGAALGIAAISYLGG
ncbi:hypothetical protein [Methylobacterium sp. 1030]|uniref:hypothetical protein n=1 Tax=Methylobacterium sp. 1030 TaxID=3156404 RepID=UPI003397FF94